MPRTRKPRQPKAYWLTMGPEPWLATCGGCGQHIQKPPMPLPFESFNKLLKAYVDVHSVCSRGKVEDVSVQEALSAS